MEFRERAVKAVLLCGIVVFFQQVQSQMQRDFGRMPETVWYDAFHGCTPEPEDRRDERFRAENKKWSGLLTRFYDEGLDLWLEPVPPRVSVGIERVRIRLSEAYLDRTKCLGRQRAIPTVSWDSSEEKVRAQGVPTWYRAAFHRESCELAGIGLSDVQSQFVRDRSIEMEDFSSCKLSLMENPIGLLLHVKCGSENFVFANSRDLCRVFLEFEKNFLTDDERKEYGWEEEELEVHDRADSEARNSA